MSPYYTTSAVNVYYFPIVSHYTHFSLGGAKLITSADSRSRHVIMNYPSSSANAIVDIGVKNNE